MAKVLLKNMAEHDITLNVVAKNDVGNVETLSNTIPGGRLGPEGFAPGTGFIEDDVLAEAKKLEVVKFYFESGKLVEDKPAAAPKAK